MVFEWPLEVAINHVSAKTQTTRANLIRFFCYLFSLGIIVSANPVSKHIKIRPWMAKLFVLVSQFFSTDFPTRWRLPKNQLILHFPTPIMSLLRGISSVRKVNKIQCDIWWSIYALRLIILSPPYRWKRVRTRDAYLPSDCKVLEYSGQLSMLLWIQ